MDGGRILDKAHALKFLMGGYSTFTVVGKSTRFTYKTSIGKGKWTGCLFVKVLTGPDTFSAIGMIRSGTFVHTDRGGIGHDAQSVQAFGWLFRHGLKYDAQFAKCEFWHSGHCGRCGRALTVPESIAQGLGPKCARAD